MGVLRPLPQVGGVHAAIIPVPPKEDAVKVSVEVLATMGSSLAMMVARLFLEKPFSSVMSDSRVSVWFWVILADVVRAPGRSPGRCSRISMGIHVLKLAGAELALATLAKMPVAPGLVPVTRPFGSTVATVPSTVPQVNGPMRLVISRALGAHGPTASWGVAIEEQACAVNCCVWVLEVQPATGSTTTEVTLT